MTTYRATKRGTCRECGSPEYPRGNIFTRTQDDEGKPAWQCNNCMTITPRRSRKRGTHYTPSQIRTLRRVLEQVGPGHLIDNLEMRANGVVMFTLHAKHWSDENMYCTIGRTGALRVRYWERNSSKMQVVKSSRAWSHMRIYSGNYGD